MNYSLLTQEQHDDLRRLRNDIRNLHDHAESMVNGVKTALTNFVVVKVQCGAALLKARAIVPHGDWSEFLDSVGISSDSDLRYRRLATNAGRLDNPRTLMIAYQQAGIIDMPEEPRTPVVAPEPTAKAAQYVERIVKYADKLEADDKKGVILLIINELRKVVETA